MLIKRLAPILTYIMGVLKMSLTPVKTCALGAETRLTPITKSVLMLTKRLTPINTFVSDAYKTSNSHQNICFGCLQNV